MTNLREELEKHLGFPDTYYYWLSRVKEARQYGTLTIDDFNEVDEEFIEGLLQLFEKWALEMTSEDRLDWVVRVMLSEARIDMRFSANKGRAVDGAKLISQYLGDRIKESVK